MPRRSLSLTLALWWTCAGAAPAFGQALAVSIPNPADPLLQGLVVTNDAASVGMWSPSRSWPLVSIHTALLPDGTVLTFGSPVGQGAQDGRTFVRWDPLSNQMTTTPNAQGVNSFCAAAVLQPDTGSLLISGGNEAAQSSLFDAASGAASPVSSTLASDRWYGTMTMLADGRSLMTGGSFPYAINVWQNPGSQQSLNSVSMTPEIFTPGVGWSSLFGANSREAFGPDHNRWWYPHQWVAPDGTVFGISSEKWWRLDPSGNGSIIALGDFKTGQNDTTRPNIGPTSTAVLYDVGLVLQVGGNGYTNEQDTVSSERATVIDINGDSPIITDVASMQFRRQWLNSIVTPNGEVIVTGGTQRGDRGNPDAVYQAELWDPDTRTFRGLASASIIRNYHSTTILLPNGTIFSSGGGVPGPVTNFNYEIFYPPYLFQASSGADVLADRPRMVSIDGAHFAYATSFQVEMADSRAISRVAIIGLGTTTHSFDMGQRYYAASFSQSGNVLTVNAPPGPNLAPPGFHQLFTVDAAGVPSRGFVVSLGESACNSDGECDDANDCSIDECSGGVCSHENVCTDPLAIYPFESGAEDDTGSGRNGTLVSGASIAPGLSGNAVDIDGGTEHVDLPDGLVSDCDDFTFASWVRLDANPDWNRIFDFGSSTLTSMFLTPKVGGANVLRFALAVPGINGGAEAQISAPLTFPLNTWTHVAVVLEGDVGRLYVDGAEVGTATIVGNPADMGATVNNWLGRSQWPDPHFNGQLDEVQLSCRAYSTQEIVGLANRASL
jgi:hypothetical protein